MVIIEAIQIGTNVSTIGVLGIEILLYGLVRLLHLPFSLLFVLRLAETRLVVFAFLCHSFLLLRCSLFVLLLLCRVQNLPHFADFSSDVGNPIARKLVFDKWVDVHAIEKEGAHGLLWRLRLGWIFPSAHKLQSFRSSDRFIREIGI